MRLTRLLDISETIFVTLSNFCLDSLKSSRGDMGIALSLLVHDRCHLQCLSLLQRYYCSTAITAVHDSASFWMITVCGKNS